MDIEVWMRDSAQQWLILQIQKVYALPCRSIYGFWLDKFFQGNLSVWVIIKRGDKTNCNAMKEGRFPFSSSFVPQTIGILANNIITLQAAESSAHSAHLISTSNTNNCHQEWIDKNQSPLLSSHQKEWCCQSVQSIGSVINQFDRVSFNISVDIQAGSNANCVSKINRFRMRPSTGHGSNRWVKSFSRSVYLLELPSSFAVGVVSSCGLYG